MKKRETKEMYYAALIYDQIMKLFNDEECDNHMDLSELSEENNATCFVHALSCASAFFYKELTGEDCDYLEFNHVANRLIHQFSKEK